MRRGALAVRHGAGSGEEVQPPRHQMPACDRGAASPPAAASTNAVQPVTCSRAAIRSITPLSVCAQQGTLASVPTGLSAH